MEELDEKIKEAEAEFEAKTLEQLQKAEKEKVAIEDVRKMTLETLAETKKQKQQEEVKWTKKSRTTGNETLAYLREKAAKDHEVRMLQMKTQNEETRAQRLLLKQHHHQWQQQQTQPQMLLLLQHQQQAMMALFEKLSKKGE